MFYFFIYVSELSLSDSTDPVTEKELQTPREVTAGIYFLYECMTSLIPFKKLNQSDRPHIW